MDGQSCQPLRNPYLTPYPKPPRSSGEHLDVVKIYLTLTLTLTLKTLQPDPSSCPLPTASPPPLPSLTTHAVSFGSEVHDGLSSKRCPAICPYGFTWLGSGSYKMSQSERDTLPDSPICVLTVHPPPSTPPPLNFNFLPQAPNFQLQ